MCICLVNIVSILAACNTTKKKTFFSLAVNSSLIVWCLDTWQVCFHLSLWPCLCQNDEHKIQMPMRVKCKERDRNQSEAAERDRERPKMQSWERRDGESVQRVHSEILRKEPTQHCVQRTTVAVSTLVKNNSQAKLALCPTRHTTAASIPCCTRIWSVLYPSVSLEFNCE